MTYYIIRNGEIINAVETTNGRDRVERMIRDLPAFAGCTYDANPPLEMLQRYQYWNERP